MLPWLGASEAQLKVRRNGGTTRDFFSAVSKGQVARFFSPWPPPLSFHSYSLRLKIELDMAVPSSMYTRVIRDESTGTK